MRAFIFPGQGSQSLGMGHGLAEAYPVAKAVFQEVDEALGESLSGVIWGEDAAALTLTANAQPALMAVSIALVRAMKGEGLSLSESGAFVAGHSLGEYSALVAADSLDLSDAAQLLRLRGQAMQDAVPLGQGAMAAILGLDFNGASEVVRGVAGVALANDNAVGQVVISGKKEAVAQAVEAAKAAGAKKAVMLDVSAPFHCPLMAPAAAKMKDALAAVELRTPTLPLVENRLAAPTEDAAQIRDLLVEQVEGCVRWRESILFMANAGVSEFVEIGAGKVLSGMVKRIVKDARGVSIGTQEEIQKFMEGI